MLNCLSDVLCPFDFNFLVYDILPFSVLRICCSVFASLSQKVLFSSYQLCPVFIKNRVVQTEKKAKEISIMLYYFHGRNYNCKNTFFPRKAVVLRHGLRRLPLKHKNTFKTEKRTSFFKAVESTEWALSKNQYNIRRTCCRA